MSFLTQLVTGPDGRYSSSDFMALFAFLFAQFWAGYGFYYDADLPHFEFVYSSCLIFSGGLKGYKYGVGTWAYTKKIEEEEKRNE